MLNLNCAIIVLPMCRNLLTWLRTTEIARLVPLNYALEFHKLIAATIGAATVVHATCHYLDYAWHAERGHIDSVAGAMLASWPCVSGHLIGLGMLAMFATSTERVRRRKFKMGKVGDAQHHFEIMIPLSSTTGAVFKSRRRPARRSCRECRKFQRVGGPVGGTVRPPTTPLPSAAGQRVTRDSLPYGTDVRVQRRPLAHTRRPLHLRARPPPLGARACAPLEPRPGTNRSPSIYLFQPSDISHRPLHRVGNERYLHVRATVTSSGGRQPILTRHGSQFS